jgi:hypothetical protein
MLPMEIVQTFHSSGWGVLKRIDRHGECVGSGWSIRDGSYLRGTLAKVGPFVGGAVIEAVGYSTV